MLTFLLSEMPIDRRLIESNLIKKGFVEEDSDHKYFYHEYNGKRTGIYTFTSHGSGYKIYNDNLISMMKKQLKLDTNSQAKDLFQCPMSGEEYNQILLKKKSFKFLEL